MKGETKILFKYAKLGIKRSVFLSRFQRCSLTSIKTEPKKSYAQKTSFFAIYFESRNVSVLYQYIFLGALFVKVIFPFLKSVLV